ncbi:MAG: tetratricopeptide repeat protein, partial [Bacteroidota bacterium]
VNFRVINLGETKIPNSKHGVNLEHLIKRGITLDLGGKTPLGRQDKPYTLIQTVAGMLHYLRNEGNRVEHIDKNLPYILESTCYIYGDEQLHKAYYAQKTAFLSASAIYKGRAIVRMLDGVVEWDYTHPDTVGPKPKKQIGNIEEFQLQLDIEDQGKLYDVKKEIYRLPDRLLYGLAFYYGIVPRSGWDAVEQLFDRNIIRSEAVQYLGYIMSFANMLRLKTYLHYGQQKEGLTMLGGLSQEEAQGEIKKALCLPPEALQTDGSLFKYYYSAIPLHFSMKIFFNEQKTLSVDQELSFFSKETFYDNDDLINALIHSRLLQWRKSRMYYEEELQSRVLSYGNHPSVAKILANLGLVCLSLSEYRDARQYLDRALLISESIYEGNHPSVAKILANLGLVCLSLSEYRDA